MHALVEYAKELYKYRGLVRIWSLREIKVRYKQSALGVAWAVLQPVSMMLVFTVVFSFFTRIPTGGVPYPIFSYSAILPWTLLATSITFGVPSLVNNLNLVVKTYFPKEILPIGSVVASLFDFIIASSIFVLLLLYYHIPLTWSLAWLPLILFIQLLLTLGVTFLGAAVIVLYRDVRFIVPLVLQIWFFATPIIYPITLIPEELKVFYFLNPMAGIITSYRAVILNGQPPFWRGLSYSAVVAVALFFVGYLVFKRLEVSFADII